MASEIGSFRSTISYLLVFVFVVAGGVHASPVLKPPFRVVQNGQPRTGSTFQTTLLYAIMSVKSPPGSKVLIESRNREKLHDAVVDGILSNHSFIVKTHAGDNNNLFLEILQRIGIVSVFSSGARAPFAMYNQQLDRLLNCSLCEVDRYKALFGMTNAEVAMVKEHMRMYQILRRCCGSQMSKYRRLQLHNCDYEQFKSYPDYPWCENEDLHAVETAFAQSPVPYHLSNSPKWNWNKPGDCDRIDQYIIEGLDMGGTPFQGCEKLMEFTINQEKQRQMTAHDE